MADDSVYQLRRRTYLLIKACEVAPFYLAAEAVATTALEHPEWDMEESKTWEEWEAI